MFGEAAADLLEDAGDGGLVVVAGDPDDDVGLLDLLDAPGQISPKSGVVVHISFPMALFFSAADFLQADYYRLFAPVVLGSLPPGSPLR